MTLEEASNRLSNFDSWFQWNELVLNKKSTKHLRILLESFLDANMVSKLQTDDSVTSETPVRGPDGLLEKLEGYFFDDYPLINRRHDFTTCK